MPPHRKKAQAGGNSSDSESPQDAHPENCQTKRTIIAKVPTAINIGGRLIEPADLILRRFLM
jgi:hypothetical protein